MKLKNRWGLLIILVLVLAFASRGSDKNVVASEAKVEPPDYQGIIDEVLDDERIGVALLVRTPEFEYFGIRGYVDWENQVPLNKDHLFRIASCTKTFVATLAAILHFEGELDLDDTITNYLPDSITSHVQYADEITIRQLLSHTSGIFDITDNPEYWEAQFSDPMKERTDIQVLEFAYDKPAYFEPGAGSHYSNTNYLLAGLILDKVLGYHHSQEVRRKILEPLELDSTFYEQQEEFDRTRLSHGYFDFDGDGIAEDYYDLRIDTGHADSALVSTVEDMELFIRSLFTRSDFPDVSYRKEFLQELTELGPRASGEPGETGSGLGIMGYDYGYGKGYGHSGGTPGYASRMLYFPDRDVSFALTMNGIDGGFSQLRVLFTLYEDLIGATFSALGVEKTLDEKIAGRLREGNVYQDPEGRFTIPLVGDWTQVETNETYALLALTEPPLDMYVVTAESSDLEAGMDAALRQVGIDPGALTLKDTGKFGNWNIFYHSLGDGKGVTILAQVKDETTYCLIGTGDEAITMNPPENLVKTVGGFTLAGEEVILPTTVDEFEAYIMSFVGDRPPALSIAIALGSDVIYTKGFGMADGPKGMAATPDTVYQWGSMAKIVTATAIMQLREKGLVDLDAPASHYLDYFPAEYPITVRQIVSHSSGLPEPTDYVPFNLRLEGQPLPDPDLWARRYLDELTSLIFESGSASAYSSPNSVILGQIVAEVSGKSYIEYARENILGPLGMENTDFTYSSEAMTSKAAAGAFLANEVEAVIAMLDEIRGRGDGADFVREVYGDLAWMNRFSVFAPAGGGLIGPVTEVIRFLGMHLNGGEFEGVRILSPASVSLMQEMQLSTKGTPLGFGLGWEVIDDAEHPYVEHAGGGYGIQDLMRLYPNERLAIVIMSNLQGYNHEGAVDAAANVIFSMLGTEKKEPDIEGPDTGQALQGLLDQQVQEQGILGMAMAVRLADGTVIGTGSGYSDPSGGEAWSIDTVSAIGSVTKTFTAVVIMQLAEEGKLSIDDTIDTWFPKQPNGDRITIRMLLSHTSGLANYISAENVMEERWNKKWAPMDLVAEANKSGPVGEPGSSDAHYSNTNYVLLGLIVEEVTGNDWAQEVESRIIKPLGLKDTAFLSKEGILDIMVGGYAKKEVGYQNLLEAPGYPHPSTAWSAGAITSTVSDLITYASALFKDDLFESRETLEEMLQPLASQDFGGGQLADLGLGLMRIQIPGMTIWGHPGDVPGYAAFIGYDPNSGATVAATVNTVGGDVIMPAISALQYLSQIQQGEQVPAEPALAQAGNVYQDPQGRFTIPLVGDWTRVETDGTYGLFELTGRPLRMYIITVESDDLEVSVDAALRRVDIDPAALVVTLLGGWEKWSLFYYSQGDGKGVTVLAQIKDDTSYLIVATGDEALTANPPDNVMQTVGGFAFTGEELILPTTVDEFEAYIKSFVGEVTPSLSVVIALGKDVIYAKGFGMADGPKDMRATPDTVYQWGSVTKIATAAAIMQLREKGLVDLDAPVSRYLDYFPTEYPITVRHLLSHSSGLPEPTEFEWVNVRLNGTPLPDPDLVDRTYYKELTGLMFEPGSDSAYVNPDYVTLGQIVAQVSGKPYIQYIQENILTPLGMKTTDFTYKSDAMINNAAACAVLATEAEAMIATMDRIRGLGDGADFFGETDDQYTWMNPYNPMAGAGGLVGPATEAIRFAQMLLNGGEIDGVQILSAESVALMREVQLSIDGTPLAFGLGWHVFEKDEHPYIEHDGGGPGIAAKVRLYPDEGFAIVLMSNGTGFDRNEVTDAAANVVFSMLEG